MNAKILIVDDEPNVRLMTRFALEGNGYEVYEADSAANAPGQSKLRRRRLSKDAIHRE